MTTRHLRNTAILGAAITLTAIVSLQASPGHERRTAPTVISACGSGIVISAPGDYVLDAGDTRRMDCMFSVSNSNGIWISASDVNLDLNDNRLQFFGSPATTVPGYGILVKSTDGSRLRNVKIKGAGALVAWLAGIRLEQVDKASIDGVTAANNRTAGIETEDVERLRLTDSMMARNGTYGLKLRNSVEGHIKGNTISANGIRTAFNTTTGVTTVTWPATAPGIGIGIHGGSGNEIHKNTVTGNFGDGIAVGKFLATDDDSANTFNNEISENLSSGNLSSTGGSFTNLYVATGSGGNQIHDNESLNLEDDNFACGTNSWYNNTFITTFSSNDGANVGAITAPLSVASAKVFTGSASCAR